jgi:hypothetical protein
VTFHEIMASLRRTDNTVVNLTSYRHGWCICVNLKSLHKLQRLLYMTVNLISRPSGNYGRVRARALSVSFACNEEVTEGGKAAKLNSRFLNC